jgi:hypothetical protein
MANQAHGQANGFDIFMSVTPNGGGGQGGGGAGPRCTIQYSSESLSVDPTNKTVQALFLENAEGLSFDRNRAVAFKQGGRVIAPETPAVAGATYVASIAYEQKG